MNTNYYNHFFYANNENIIIYNGEFLSDDIKDNVTKSVENLFNNCKSIYDQKIYRSNHCIWFILSKNIPEYNIITVLKNIFAKATNKEIFKNTLRMYPGILQNIAIPKSYLCLNFINDLPSCLLSTEDVFYDNFDLLN
jgi:hypothetical protein